MKQFLTLIIFLSLTSFAQAQESFGKGDPIEPRERIQEPIHGQLTPAEIERVRAFKKLTSEVDQKSVQETVDELERTDDPQMSLQINEAVAKTYSEIAADQKNMDQNGKEWLYGMVTINVAYLQFGANADDSGNALNGMIRRKLRDYLPPQIIGSTKIKI